jgi:hypothetical protein
MRLHVALAFGLATATAGLAAGSGPAAPLPERASDPPAAVDQAPARQQDAKLDTKKDKSISIVGCVSADDATPARYTLVDQQGTTYRLTGTDMKKYVGRSVELVGTVQPDNRVHVGFGLLPSPNVAAQAGAIDPAQAAIATPHGGTTAATGGDVQLPEFKVKRVRTTRAGCP